MVVLHDMHPPIGWSICSYIYGYNDMQGGGVHISDLVVIS
jgi:hypothetical protein